MSATWWWQREFTPPHRGWPRISRERSCFPSGPDLLLTFATPCKRLACLAGSDPWQQDERESGNRFSKTRRKHFYKTRVSLWGEKSAIYSRHLHRCGAWSTTCCQSPSRGVAATPWLLQRRGWWALPPPQKKVRLCSSPLRTSIHTILSAFWTSSGWPKDKANDDVSLI